MDNNNNETIKLKAEINRLRRVNENQFQPLDTDMIQTIREFSSVKAAANNPETTIDELRAYVNGFDISLWDSFAKKFGFTSVEDMKTKGFSLEIISRPVLRLYIDPEFKKAEDKHADLIQKAMSTLPQELKGATLEVAEPTVE